MAGPPLDFGLRQSCCPVVLGLVPAEAVGLVCWEPQACTALHRTAPHRTGHVSEGQAAAADIWPKLPPVAVAEFLMDVLRERGRMEEEDAVQSGGESD